MLLWSLRLVLGGDKYDYREVTLCFGRMEDLFGRDRLSEALRERVL